MHSLGPICIEHYRSGFGLPEILNCFTIYELFFNKIGGFERTVPVPNFLL